MRSRYEGIQNYIMGAAESCFFLCLLSVAEEERKRRFGAPEEIDFLDAVRACMDKGWLKNDFTVVNDCKILSWLTGADVTKEAVQDAGIVRGNQYTIEKWVNGSRTHFRRRGWDVYKNSQTVKNGVRQCYYKYTFK